MILRCKQMAIHVYPLNDWLPHNIGSPEADCHCQPRTEWIDEGTGLPLSEPIIVHNSFDGRELLEGK